MKTMKTAALILFWMCLLIKESSLEKISVHPDKANGELSVYCECRNKFKVDSKKVETYLAENLLKQESISPSSLGHRFKNCERCKLTFIKCYGEPQVNYHYNCSKDSVAFEKPPSSVPNQGDSKLKAVQRIHENFPESVFVPHGNKSEQNRHVRQLDSCSYPTSLRTSELECTIHPTKVRCIQRCAFGYTLKEGTSVTRTCKKKLNEWKPSNFKECRPYVDCGLTLKSGGTLSCSTPVVKEAPECAVSCERYEDKEAIQLRSYACDIRGDWQPRLPFCVAPGSGLQLVPRP